MPLPPGYNPGPDQIGGWVRLNQEPNALNWTTYTPTLTATTTNPTGFSAVGTANHYQKKGDLVVVSAAMYTPSSTGNSVGTGNWRLSLPVQPKHGSTYQAIGYYYLYNSQGDAWNALVHGFISLHPTSQATSTVEFAQPYHSSGGNSVSVLPSGIFYTDKYMSWNAKFFYEAL